MEFLNVAERHIANCNYAEAIVALTEAAKDPFLRAQALRRRGHLYFDLNEFEKSIEDYTEAIGTKAPGIHGNRDGHRGRARTAIAMADYNLALDDIQNLLDLAMRGDPDQFEDVCDLIDALMLGSSKHRLFTHAERERLSAVLNFLAKTVFREGDYGVIWSSEVLTS